MIDGRGLARRAWERWLANPRPLDRIVGQLVRESGASAAASADAWLTVGAAARTAGWLAAHRDPTGWFAADLADVRRRIADIPGFWRALDNPPDRSAWRRGSPAEAVAAAGVAPWWTEPLVRRFGSDLPRFLAALDEAPPLWIRARKADEVPGLEASLRAEGFAVRRGSPLALAVRGQRPISTTQGYRDGAFEVQDLASQQVVDLLPIGKGPVWDACAGEGGKSLALAGRLGGRSAVCASDVAPWRLEQLRRRVRRAGWQNVRTFAWDGAGTPVLPREASRGFPLVLVDAPCSASGTWRRNPEVRLGPPASADLLALVAAILRNAAAAVAPGGVLALSTCSIDHRENEGQLAQLGLRGGEAGCHGSPDLDADTLFLGLVLV